jgi:molybdopterin biosynthesis enzyme
MTLASVGVSEVTVLKRLKVGIILTGKELVSHDLKKPAESLLVRDPNGPFLQTILQNLGVDVDF